MYSKTVMPVEMPKGGRIYVLKNGYVYWALEWHWDREKKRTLDNRVCIGKKVEDREGWLYPNARYFDLFGEEKPEIPWYSRKRPDSDF